MYVNNGNYRNTVFTVDKKLGGVSLTDYPKPYSILDAVTDSYSAISELNFRKLSEADYTTRLNSFFAHILATEGVDLSSTASTAFGTDATSCPINQSAIMYGLWYNNYAVNEATFAPTGWTLPTQAQWNLLVTDADGYKAASMRYSPLNNHPRWNYLADQDNTLEFSILPAGRLHQMGVYTGFGTEAYFWSPNSGGNYYYCKFVLSNGVLKTTHTAATSGSTLLKSGMSVRLISTDVEVIGDMEIGDYSELTDASGNVYTTKCIDLDGQGAKALFTLENWKCTNYNDGTGITLVSDITDWINTVTPAYTYPQGDILYV